MEPLEECIHGLGPVSACVICNGRAEKERQQTAEAPITFPAKYSTKCPECDHMIEQGDMVAWLDGRPAVHEDCWVSDGD